MNPGRLESTLMLFFLWALILGILSATVWFFTHSPSDLGSNFSVMPSLGVSP